jgi:serine/threonine protein kinase
MDYCEDGDLLTQILHQRRYLGQDELVKHVFLQPLDAVEYSYSLVIRYRDLKPEEMLCSHSDLRLHITDFGLATTNVPSEEFRTGILPCSVISSPLELFSSTSSLANEPTAALSASPALHPTTGRRETRNLPSNPRNLFVAHSQTPVHVVDLRFPVRVESHRVP